MKGNQRITLTKKLLQEALLHIMEEKPLEKISITELCAESGINRTTFYRHYTVLRDVLIEMQIQFAETCNDLFPMPLSIESPKLYLENLCSLLHRNSKLIKIFIRNNSEEDIIHLFDEFFQKMIPYHTDLIKKQSIDDADLKLICTYIAGGSYFMLRRWLLEDIEKTPQEIASLVLTFLKNTYIFK